MIMRIMLALSAAILPVGLYVCSQQLDGGYIWQAGLVVCGWLLRECISLLQS